MDSLLEANIFFFITSIAVVLVTIALLVGLYFAIQLVREARRVVALVHSEVEGFRAQRRHLVSRVRFAGKWLSYVGRYYRIRRRAREFDY